MDEQRKIRINRRPKKAKSMCPTCSYLIFDEKWGEYKCKKRCIRLYDMNERTDCKLYKKAGVDKT